MCNIWKTADGRNPNSNHDCAKEDWLPTTAKISTRGCGLLFCQPPIQMSEMMLTLMCARLEIPEEPGQKKRLVWQEGWHMCQWSQIAFALRVPEKDATIRTNNYPGKNPQ